MPSMNLVVFFHPKYSILVVISNREIQDEYEVDVYLKGLGGGNALCHLTSPIGYLPIKKAYYSYEFESGYR